MIGLKPHEREDLATHVRYIKGSTEEALALLRGKEVILRHKYTGKRRQGRAGVITDIMPDQRCGLRALVMVWSKTCPWDFPNSDSWTRSYWPLDTLEFTGRTFAPGDCSSGWVETK